ncbi:hypothetical protein CDL12_20895 [Handroanthus impetiginosus]|uniref:Uncharacterized protein n=1 Tax=Handroanthus impetiginosus TaxID=429701 RepID=A0A2G9GMQ9_9LAMI|nr:hypothetical protein CDL12_20895 [Handroanthus impetiginosus]
MCGNPKYLNHYNIIICNSDEMEQAVMGRENLARGLRHMCYIDMLIIPAFNMSFLCYAVNKFLGHHALHRSPRILRDHFITITLIIIIIIIVIVCHASNSPMKAVGLGYQCAAFFFFKFLF